jgi:hypothetical protein
MMKRHDTRRRALVSMTLALTGTPEQISPYVRSEHERRGQLIKANNIRPD